MLTSKNESNQSIDWNALFREKGWTWGELADLIIECEQTAYWAGTNTSFTAWIANLADVLDVTPSTVWRHYSSGKFYKNLSKEINATGKTECPELSLLPTSVSPESLELLQKLGRVVQGKPLHDMALKVIEGKMTRADLRSEWKSYRQTLNGRTARGRGVIAPTVNNSDGRYDSVYKKGEIFSTIKQSDKSWIYKSKPEFFRLYSDVRPEFNKDRKFVTPFDVVFVEKERFDSPLVINIIFIRGDNNLLADRAMKSFHRAVPYCNFVWIAVNDPEFNINHEYLPTFVGVILVHNGDVNVLRRPTSAEDQCSRIGELSKSLIFSNPAV